MRSAICLTPDRNFFGPALCVADQIIAAGLPPDADLFLICEEADLWPRYDEIGQALRNKIKLIVTSFDGVAQSLHSRLNGEAAIVRRLFLDRILPDAYERIIPVDSDMMIEREGLGPLASLDLASASLAAAIDMISYMDHGGPLAAEFQAYRNGLGLTQATPYFNNGLTVIDRQAWTREDLGERALRFIIDNPEICVRFEQSALNAIMKGNFTPLSPRFNFMGDFLLLDLEREIRPAVTHFVNRPKPWEEGWSGDPRYAETFRRWFALSPWPDFPAPPARHVHAPVNWPFRQALLSFLKTQRFADGWQA